MRRADLALLAGMLLAGCAALAPGLPAKPMFRNAQMTPGAAVGAVTPGRTTRAELAATLGDAETLRFDSGNEVWVYRARPADPARPELVVLLGPDGVVRKVRVRPGEAH